MLKKFLSDLLGRDSVTAEDAKLAASLFNEADESVQDEVKEDLDAVQEKADAGESDDSKPEADEPKEEEQKLSEKAVANMLSAKDAQIKALQEKLNATTLAENVDSFLLSEGEAGMGLAPNEENKKMLSELLVTLNEDQVKAMKALFERVANVEAEAKGAEANKVVLNDGTDLAAKAAERAVQLMSEDSSLTVREANAKARKELSMA
jgi:DNA phosphorothioation-dependent restriction protein DptG